MFSGFFSLFIWKVANMCSKLSTICFMPSQWCKHIDSLTRNKKSSIIFAPLGDFSVTTNTCWVTNTGQVWAPKTKLFLYPENLIERPKMRFGLNHRAAYHLYGLNQQKKEVAFTQILQPQINCVLIMNKISVYRLIMSAVNNKTQDVWS